MPPALAVLSLVLGAALLFFVGPRLATSMRVLIAGSELLLVGPGLVMLVLARVPLARGLGFRPISARTLGLAAATALALWVASLGLLELQFTVWRPRPEYLEILRQLHEALRPHGPWEAVLSLATIAVIPALCEETLLRGIVLPSLLRMGAAGAVIVSSLLFALIHFDLYRFAFTLTVGLVLGVLRLRTGSLWTSIVVHAVLNATTFVTVPFVDDPTGALPEPRPGLGAAMLAVGGTVAALLIRLIRPDVPLTDRGAAPRLDP